VSDQREPIETGRDHAEASDAWVDQLITPEYVATWVAMLDRGPGAFADVAADAKKALRLGLPDPTVPGAGRAWVDDARRGAGNSGRPGTPQAGTPSAFMVMWQRRASITGLWSSTTTTSSSA
jgi:hypothetical protein